jgi:tetratricopeptide (TPR) repeat protein
MGLLTIEWAPIEMVRSGDYTGAIAALSDSWPGVGQKPHRQRGATDREYGFLLLACGMISIKLGRFDQSRCFEIAKDMLSESARLLHGEPEECAARLHLGTAYSDCGEYREALAVADAVLEMEADSEVVFAASVLKAAALKHQGELAKAWKTLKSIELLAAAVTPIARGNYFIERGTLQRRLGNLDQSLTEYDDAEHCFLNNGNMWHVAIVLNNAAGIYTDQARFNLAHNAASRAVSLFRKANDKAFEAKALDQTANIYLAQGLPCEAEPIARRAVSLLESGDNRSWLAEALITHSRALMRMGTEGAKIQIQRAVEICDEIGDARQGAEAQEAAVVIFKNARTLSNKLRECLRRIEPAIIKYALRLNGNRIPPTARFLGMSRQNLEDKLTRMSDVRPTKRRRARPIFRK